LPSLPEWLGKPIGHVLKTLRAAWDLYFKVRGGTLAAAISYRALFAIAPLLVVAVAVAGAIFGEDAASGELGVQLGRALGSEIAQAIEELVLSASRSRTAGWIGALIFLWAGSGLFVEVQGAFRVIYDIPPERLTGFWSAVRWRLVTLGAVIVSALMLALLVGGAVATTWLEWEWAAGGLGLLVSASVLIGGLALAFRYLTIEHPPWRYVAVGALATSLAVVLAAWGVGQFIARGGGGEASGVAGSLVAVLLAVYVLANVVLLGVALTKTASLNESRNL
jgi:membrane protein